MRYVVTGGTGFIGSRVVSRIIEAEAAAQVWVLVRRSSLTRFERLSRQWGEPVKPLVGDLTADGLGLADETIAELGEVTHVVHCAARSTTSPPARRSSASPTWRAPGP